MKKIVNILSLISWISLIPIGILLVASFLTNPRNEFIITWFMVILGPLVLPLLLKGASLARNKDLIPPPVWMTIYSILVILYIVMMLNVDFFDHTRDMPLAFSKKFISIEGKVLNLRYTNSKQTFEVAGQTFVLQEKHFNGINADGIYKVIYLPNSKYVIDVIGENGRSLSKKR